MCLQARRVPDELRFRLRVRRPHVLQRVLRPHGGGADCPRGECPDDLRDGRPEPPIQLKDRDSLTELVNGPGGATSYPAAVGHPSSWTEPPDQLEDHGIRPEFADVPSGAAVDQAALTTSSRTTASVWSSRTCQAVLPRIRPPSVLLAARRSHRFSL